MKDFINGFKKSIPIFVGYFVVSFAFGLYCVNSGIMPLTAIIISLTNLSSAGQFGGVELISKKASFLELGFVVLVINLRYILMSISLSQKLEEGVKLKDKLIFSFAITDEIYALAVKEKKINAKFMFGMMIMPIVGWTLGTAFGTFASNLFSESIRNSFNIALYAMFISALVPDCRGSLKITFTVLVSAVFSSLLYYVPFLSENISLGFRIVIVVILVCTISALLFPLKEEGEDI